MAVNTTYKTATLDAPGASLYYEVRGSGPILLMMPGGPADATTFRKIENDLASRYTVVTMAIRFRFCVKLSMPLGLFGLWTRPRSQRFSRRRQKLRRRASSNSIRLLIILTAQSRTRSGLDKNRRCFDYRSLFTE